MAEEAEIFSFDELSGSARVRLARSQAGGTPQGPGHGGPTPLSADWLKAVRAHCERAADQLEQNQELLDRLAGRLGLLPGAGDTLPGRLDRLEAGLARLGNLVLELREALGPRQPPPPGGETSG